MHKMLSKLQLKRLGNGRKSFGREKGYSMTEVLLSILLLSTSMLGTVAVQVVATRTTQQSTYQTMALQLAADIADTVQAAASAGTHAEEAGLMFDLDYTSIPGSLPAFTVMCHSAECEPSEFAAHEIGEWKMRLAATFPAARLRICRDADPSGEAGQAYKWDCSGGGDAPLVIKLGWKVKNPDGSYPRDGDNFPPSVVVPVAAASDWNRDA